MESGRQGGEALREALRRPWVVSSHEYGEFAADLEDVSRNGANRRYGGAVVGERITTYTLPGPMYGATTVAVLGSAWQ